MDAIRTVYSVLLALLVALTIGLGVQAAYPAPAEPAGADIFEDPTRLGEIEEYKEDDAIWERNVFLAGGVVAVAVAVAGLLALPLGGPIRLGLMLGGVLALIWSAQPDITNSIFLTGEDVTAQVFPEGRLDTTSRILQFLISLTALAVVLLAGRLRFGGAAQAPALEGESQVEIEREELRER